MEKFIARKISLYDRVFIEELINQPFNLYGANIDINKMKCWTPIDYKQVTEYDIVIERSIPMSDRFIWI
ncbi:MAG: hypothetical protein BV457_03410 [Thermoplasmata archaeon M9B1D]|nr:MAG: hypothetical protein BV457_03410 [Thermoplasmata archaeon M9B1D]